MSMLHRCCRKKYSFQYWPVGQTKSFENGHLTFAKESFDCSNHRFQGLAFAELTSI